MTVATDATHAADLDRYLHDIAQVGSEALLGSVVMFRVAEPHQVSREKLQSWFDELGLDSAMYMPPPIKIFGAFERACAEVKHAYDVGRKGELTATVTAVKVATSPERLVYHLVRQITDGKKERLHYSAKIGELVLYRAGRGKAADRTSTRIKQQIFVHDPATGDQQLAPFEEGIVEDLMARTMRRHSELCDFYAADKLRSIVREYLLGPHLNAVRLIQSGGTYFVPKTRHETLARLATLVERYGGTSTMRLVPCLDLPRLREMVIEDFRSETREQLQELSAELATVTKANNPITAERAAKLKARYDLVLNRAQEYTETLDAALEDAGDAIDLVRVQLQQVAMLVEG